MTADITLGELLDLAIGHLNAALTGWDQEPGNPAPVARQLHRVVNVMTRYMDDLTPWDEAEALGRTDLTSWQHAAVDITAALHTAADSLDYGITSRGDDGLPGAISPARRLADAASALIAGRDLLHTHQTLSPDGLREERSEWAPVISSQQVAKTLTHHFAHWSQRLAPWATELAFRLPDGPPGMNDEVFAAARWLRTAGAAARPAQHADPVSADDLALRAIPPATMPARQAPRAGETAAQLCQGISLSTTRLQAATRDSGPRPASSPGVTAGAWQWTATAGAVTSHLSENLMRSLAGPAAQLGLPAAAMHTAADAMTGARAAWHQVATTWDGITTETRFLASATVTEAGDLVLRLGRLTWDDPAWTPAVHRTAQRGPDLAHGAADAAGIVSMIAAVHRSAYAFARVAAADLSAVQSADRAGRLYVPTRTLPESFDIPRPYAIAPAERSRVLIQAYQVAVHASDLAVQALDRIAVATSAPSHPLALARTAAHGQRAGPSAQPIQDPEAPDGQSITRDGPGSVEEAIRRLGVSEPVLLLRAAAIDKAGRNLIDQAQRAAEWQSQHPDHQHSHPGSPAQLAAASFPEGPATPLPPRTPGDQHHGETAAHDPTPRRHSSAASRSRGRPT